MSRKVHAAFFFLVVTALANAEPLVPVAGSPNPSHFILASEKSSLSKPMSFVLALNSQNQAAADSFVQSQYDPASPNFHQWIDGKEYAARFGATPADIGTVTAYLNSQGLKNVRVSENGLFISASGSASQVGNTFHTTFASFERPPSMTLPGDPKVFTAPATTPMLPLNVGSRVAAAHGLSNLLIPRPAYQGRISPPPPVATGYLSPYDLRKGYNGTALHNLGLSGLGMTIAVYSPTIRYVNDPLIFAEYFGIGGFTIKDIVIDSGATDANGSTEAALDLENIIGQAPNCTVNVYESPGDTASELDTFNAILAAKIPVVSSSWGFEEHDLILGGAQSAATSFNTVCQSLAAAGISIFVASGDSGIYSRHSAGVITTQMESSCQWTTGVGGTTLQLTPLGVYSTESAWTYNTGQNSGGGGGLSQIFARPTWQAGPGVISSYSNGKRQVPDIAAAANDPYYIYTNGAWGGIGGTSAAAPLWAANVLLMDQEYRKTTAVATKSIGFINPSLYALGTRFENPATILAGCFYVYHDITTGFNGKELATPDWDFCTGWGSVDFYKLMEDLGDYNNIAGFRPNLAPFNPHATIPAWTNPVMIHTSPTVVTEPSSFSHLTTLYFGVCRRNGGNADAAACSDLLQIDGVTVATVGARALPVGLANYFNSVYSAKLTAGSHKITYIVNTGNKVLESSYLDNTFSRTITVL